MNDSLYAQVFSALTERIESGQIAVGEKLPTQSRLSQEFSVSAITSSPAQSPSSLTWVAHSTSVLPRTNELSAGTSRTASKSSAER